jgi:hypothetical protein
MMKKYIVIIIVTLVFITACGEKLTSPDRDDHESVVTHLSLECPNTYYDELIVRISLGGSAWVILEVSTIDGHELEVLINEYLSAGCHTVYWNTNDVSSGVYALSLKADGYQHYRKISVF